MNFELKAGRKLSAFFMSSTIAVNICCLSFSRNLVGLWQHLYYSSAKQNKVDPS